MTAAQSFDFAAKLEVAADGFIIENTEAVYDRQGFTRPPEADEPQARFLNHFYANSSAWWITILQKSKH
jgi:hypothetical protein